MKQSVFSDITEITKTDDIEGKLSELSEGEIIRYAVTKVLPYGYEVSYSYKK